MSHRQRELEGLPETRRERIMACVNAMVQNAVEEVQNAVADARAREGEALRQSTVVLMQQLFRARGIDESVVQLCSEILATPAEDDNNNSARGDDGSDATESSEASEPPQPKKSRVTSNSGTGDVVVQTPDL